MADLNNEKTLDRETIRENTMQLIYQMEINGEYDYEKLNPVEENIEALEQDQAIATLTAVRDHISEIDDVIRNNLDKWSIERVSKTDLAILRNAVAEMMYVDTIPVSVSINEAVNLSRKFGDEKSYAFVNSVLSKVNRYLKDRK